MSKAMSHQQLITEFENKIESTRKLLLGINWSDRGLYTEWLAQTYFFVKHTIGFMGTQVTRFNLISETSLAGILEHFREEQGHDRLLLNDLKHLKKEIGQFKEYPETRAFYQSQYYWIDYKHPDAHLGYSLFLEGLAAKIGPELFATITKQQGPNCGTFIKVHSDADLDHFADGCSELKRLSPELLGWVYENLEQTWVLYEAIIKKVSASYRMNQAA